MILLVIHGLQFCFSWRLRFFVYISYYLTTPKRRWSLVSRMSRHVFCQLSRKFAKQIQKSRFTNFQPNWIKPCSHVHINTYILKFFVIIFFFLHCLYTYCYFGS